MKSLTSDQIALLLDVVASGGDLSRYMGDLKKADPDMAATVGQFLKSRGGKAGLGEGTRLASDQRRIENWNSLWRQWDDVVAEVGNEDGKYAVQDRHWEAPYFAGGDLAFDLEPIAGDMLPLIADVYGLVDAPDLYFEALEEIEDNISLYPEWMGAEYGDPFELERKATRCVLKWLWLEAQHEPDPGIGLLERVSDIEESHRLLYLNRIACVEFFVRLPDNVCREIHTYFKDADHNFDLSKVYSIWHQINHDYESRFDSATYLETCRKHLDDNWRYGRPLIDDALERDRFKDAEILLGKTFASFLGKSKRARWYPETTLLVGQQYFIENQDREEISDLLQTWNEVAVNLDDAKCGAAVKLQSIIF